MELDIALYNLSRGGGVITSHQLSLQPGTANRKVSNVAAGEKIREENPKNRKAILREKKKNLLYIYFGSESNKIEWSNQNVIVRSFWATHKKIKK